MISSKVNLSGKKIMNKTKFDTFGVGGKHVSFVYTKRFPLYRLRKFQQLRVGIFDMCGFLQYETTDSNRVKHF